jgi:acyl carrier protein
MSGAETRESLMNVHEVLTDYLSREVLAKTGQPLPTLDQPLLDSNGGVIDSLSMWPLIVFVESHFGIEIEDTDLMQENFETLRALTKLIETKHSGLQS